MADLIKKLLKGKGKRSEPQPQNPSPIDPGDRERRHSEPLKPLDRRNISNGKIKTFPAGAEGPYNRDPRMRNNNNRILAQSSNRRPNIDHENPPPAPRRAPEWTDRLRENDYFKNGYNINEQYDGGRERGGYGGDSWSGGDRAREGDKKADRVYSFTPDTLGDFQREQEENKAAGKETFATLYYRVEAKKEKIMKTKKELAQWQRDQEALKQVGKQSHATRMFGRAGPDQVDEGEEDDVDNEDVEPQQIKESVQRDVAEDNDAKEPKKGKKDNKEKKGQKDKKGKKGKKAKEADIEEEDELQPPTNGEPTAQSRVTAIKNEAGDLLRRVSSAFHGDRGLPLKEKEEESEQASRSVPATAKPALQRERSRSSSTLPAPSRQGSGAVKRQPSSRSRQVNPEDDERKLDDMVSSSHMRSSMKRGTGVGQKTSSSRPKQAIPEEEDEDEIEAKMTTFKATSELESASRKEEEAAKIQGSELFRVTSEKLDAMLAKSLQAEEDQGIARTRSDLEVALEAQEAEAENASRRAAAFGAPERAHSVPATGESKSRPQALSGHGRHQSSVNSAGGPQSFSNSKAKSSAQTEEVNTSPVSSGIGRRASTSAAKTSVKERASQIENQISTTSINESSRVPTVIPTVMNRGFADGRRTYLEGVRPIAEIDEDEDDDDDSNDDGDDNDYSGDSGDSSASQAQSVLQRGFGDTRRSLLEAVRPITENARAGSKSDAAGGRRKTVGGAGRR